MIQLSKAQQQVFDKLKPLLGEEVLKELGQIQAVMSKDEISVIRHAITMYRSNAIGCYNLSLRIQKLEFEAEEYRKVIQKHIDNEKPDTGLFADQPDSVSSESKDIQSIEVDADFLSGQNGTESDKESETNVDRPHQRSRSRR